MEIVRRWLKLKRYGDSAKWFVWRCCTAAAWGMKFCWNIGLQHRQSEVPPRRLAESKALSYLTWHEEIWQLFLKTLWFSPVHRTHSVSVESGTDHSVTLESPSYENQRTIPSSAVSEWTHIDFRHYLRQIRVKGKAVPLQAWSGPLGSRKLRFPDYMTTAQDGGKVVSLTHLPPLPPGNAPGTHFC
jgi:hypothetical protein